MLAALLVGCLLAAASGLILCPQPACALELSQSFIRKFGCPDAALLTPNNTVAVDLGNTNSCIAGFDDDTAVFHICIPTRLAALADNGALILGEAAAAVDRPALFGLNRLLGKTWFVSGVDNDGVARQRLRIWEAVAAVFTELRSRAEAYTGRGRVYHAVLTVPYYFDDRAAMVAATLAGLNTVRIVDEPTAAAVADGLHRRGRGNVLVLHVGGGTSAAAVLTYRDGGFEGVGSAHDLLLGGDDFSRRITDHLVQLIMQRHGVDATSKDNGAFLTKIKTESERAKKELSYQHCDHVNIVFCDNANAQMLFSETLTRTKFEELNHDLFVRVMALMDRAMGESGLNRSKHLIDDIVLIGGSTKIPRIRHLVKSYFDGKEPMSIMAPARPERIVAYGGALLGYPAVGGYRCRGRDWRQHYNSTDWCDPDERTYWKKADGGSAACGSTFLHAFVMVIHRAKAECFHLIRTWLETISSYFQNTSPSTRAPTRASNFEEFYML